jgi:hypothetical protein
MKRKVLKFLRITLIILTSLFVLLSILPYLLPVNQQKVDFKNPPFAESKFMSIDGKRWHYRQFEPSDSARGTMILVHGFSGSTFSWRKNQQVFADSGYRVISVDLPAFGFSEKDKNLMLSSVLNSIEQLSRSKDGLRHCLKEESIFSRIKF